MATLSVPLRGKLEKAIGKEKDTGGARAIAELAARAALQRLDVDRDETRGHLSDAERKLRVKLWARARQLGDRVRKNEDGKDARRIDRLVEACAYEHWHRMLFARFLAENDLLWHPDGYAVSIADCEEFAREEGVDTWEIAGRYASRALPQIFRPDDPLLAVRLAPEHRQELEGILAGLDGEVFRASDSLGWTYQFWQARKKGIVNKSEVKIGAEELPAVTQLFTEPYMVDFLLQNSLGAWWVGAGRKLPMEMPYLRVLQDGEPAAGRFEGWPKATSALKVLDPCCGSGHFLVVAFEILVRFRMAEGLSAREACDGVLRENLHGLEIDDRCVQIAAFALAMAAWTFPGAGGFRKLPAMNLACSGLSIAPMAVADETGEEQARREVETQKIRDRWVRAGKDVRQQRGMGRLFDLFVDAPVLGSLIDPRRGDVQQDVFAADAAELRPVLERLLREEPLDVDADEHEHHVVARGIIEAARVLSGLYHLLVTNVPYLGTRKQGEVLRRHCEHHYPNARTDLATVFIERNRSMCVEDGSMAIVSSQPWWELSSYSALRRGLLTQARWNLIGSLGEEAWTSFGQRGPRAVLTVMSASSSAVNSAFFGIDVHKQPTIEAKDHALRHAALINLDQRSLAANPDARIVLARASADAVLESLASGTQGIKTSDDPSFVQSFWERESISDGWERFLSTVEQTTSYGGMSLVLRFEDGEGRMRHLAATQDRDRRRDMQGRACWGRAGIAISSMRGLPASIYTGTKFDTNVAAIVPDDPAHLPAIWCFCTSPEFNAAVRRIDQSLKVTNATLVKVPFNLLYWQEIAAEKFPNGLPAPYSDDPTQWLFNGTVTPSDSPLQVAVARLLGYRWPDQPTDSLDALADVDGIVCIPPVAGEVPGAERLRDLLRAAYGSDWSSGREQTLLTSVGFANRSLEDWLRNGFFEQHCALFMGRGLKSEPRPFIWHIWDGHKEGFAALVNYHRLDHKALESLTFNYLGDWINRQKGSTEPGAADRLVKAEDLQTRLKLILEGAPPHDIFVRWKPLDEQPLGWNPDINDGVRLNIRPFIEANVVRFKPNIKWGKDRGKNPPGSPWGEERDNDRHLTLTEKTRAREKKA